MAGSAKTILLVEDDLDHIELIRRAFSRWEHEVDFHIAHNLRDAKTNLTELNPDIAIIDWLLPDGTGKEFLKSNFTDLSFPVIILTSQGNEQIAVSSLKDGAIDYIVKSETTLIEMPRIVERALREHRYILEKKHAEDALIEANYLLEKKVEERTSELQKSNESLEKFAYIASHDLKESLRMVSNYLQLLKIRLTDRLEEEETQFMNFALEGALRMHNLLEAIYRYSRINASESERTATDCNVIVQGVIQSLKTKIEEKKASLSIEPLPIVTADPNQIFQVFQNLIGNALKFHGAASPIIHINATEDTGEWIFAIQDNGIGIAPEYFQKIFEMFSRLHTYDTYSGDGIGLSICQQIIERHNGRIWVKSNDSQGATFFFTLPKG
ncbi:MAG: ATP-binding protein [Bacteroidia bacterium]|nr:ATP-binding protein [Bacteroidia bacterium]